MQGCIATKVGRPTNVVHAGDRPQWLGVAIENQLRVPRQVVQTHLKTTHLPSPQPPPSLIHHHRRTRHPRPIPVPRYPPRSSADLSSPPPHNVPSRHPLIRLLSPADPPPTPTPQFLAPPSRSTSDYHRSSLYPLPHTSLPLPLLPCWHSYCPSSSRYLGCLCCSGSRRKVLFVVWVAFPLTMAG